MYSLYLSRDNCAISSYIPFDKSYEGCQITIMITLIFIAITFFMKYGFLYLVQTKFYHNQLKIDM